ncbi:Nudix hydrolase domain-containing protein [Aphelenchoides bicaudatus]|nr:Nudix hydrolase domain-containing protein [Aphelenchoides bicaudatus]
MAGEEGDSTTADQNGHAHLGPDEELLLMESASASTSSSGSMKRSTTTPLQRQASYQQIRAPDMQLGRCRWVRVYDNVTYIVVGVVLRERDGKVEMLLMQEAKKKCRGKWYIPAGHVEPGETIEEAVKRELQEETGFEGQVEHLLSIEVKGSGWYRMSYFCEIAGGQLKTEPDQESLSAEWFDVDDIRGGRVNLRSSDFFKIVNEALRFRQWRLSIPTNRFKPVLNGDVTQPGLFIEFVIVKQGAISNKLEVLVHQSIETEEQLLADLHGGFPTVEFGFEYFFPMVVSKCYRHILVDGHTCIDVPRAVLGTWCLPSPIDSYHHGLRIRLLCPHKRTSSKAPIADPRRYHWLELRDEKVFEELSLAPDQFQPTLYML